MRHLPIALAAIAALFAGGQASVQAAPKDGQAQCFRASQIDASAQVPPNQLNLRTKDNHYFQIQTKGACFIGVGVLPYGLSVTDGGDIVCHAIDIDLTGTYGSPCIVDKITPMTKDQILALPKRQQP